MVTIRYSDRQGSKSRQKLSDSTSNETDQSQNGSSNLLTQYREQPRSTRIAVAYPRPAFSATHRTNYAPTSFDQQVQSEGLELVKPAREPASSRPKLCASLKKPHEFCPFAAPCGPRRRKNDRGQRLVFPLETSRFASLILAHRGSQPSPGSSRIDLPSAFAESSAYPPDGALPGSPRQCTLPLACRHPPGGHQFEARKRRGPGNTILSQPYRRLVSTDRPNREDSQLAASFEGEPGPTPAGKTFPHSYPETRFRSI